MAGTAESRRVWLCQLLCPQRHCLMMTAYESAPGRREQSQEAIQTMLDLGLLNAHCALCGSPEIAFEHGETEWKTLEEAIPHLVMLEQENAKARLLRYLTGQAEPPPQFPRNMDHLLRRGR